MTLVPGSLTSPPPHPRVYFQAVVKWEDDFLILRDAFEERRRKNTLSVLVFPDAATTASWRPAAQLAGWTERKGC